MTSKPKLTQVSLKTAIFVTVKVLTLPRVLVHIVSVARLEAFRALKLSRLESFQSLQDKSHKSRKYKYIIHIQIIFFLRLLIPTNNKMLRALNSKTLQSGEMLGPQSESFRPL